MSSDLLATIILLLIFLILIVITNYLYGRYKWTSEKSRKFIHVSGGVLGLFGVRFIKSHWWVLALCSIAFIILLITFLKKSMPSVHETKRVSYGSLLFPIPIYLCFFVSKHWNNALFFYLPISLLSFSDTLAEWGGNKWGDHSLSFFHQQKTLAGSFCFAISSLIICFILLFCLTHLPLALVIEYSFLLTLLTTLAELLTLKGFDNLTVPLSAAFILYLIL
jgi:phytol kinase